MSAVKTLKRINDMLEIAQKKATHINTLEEFKALLNSGRQLRVKYGIDPTNPNIHLGHTVPLRLLRQFQEAGHKAIIILGDFTAGLGDPSGRDSMREGVSITDARHNSMLYISQLQKIIHTDKSLCEVYNNSNWLEPMKTRDWIALMKGWTIQQIINRDDFKLRIGRGDGVYMNELLYPLMQGYDSVQVNADIELGGNEQLFTLMVGREMQKQANQKPQVCITLPILRGLDGEKRMGKSLGNFIGINEPSFEIFSKVMSIPDALMPEWFNLLTDRKELPEEIIAGVGPMAAKKMIAHDIVTWLRDKESADKAHDSWHKQFTMKDTPDEIQEVIMDGSSRKLIHLLTMCGMAESKNMARRLLSQGAVHINGKKITDAFESIETKDGTLIKCGRKFVRIKVKAE
jgi:tyrosyl-tRNA synthetase